MEATNSKSRTPSRCREWERQRRNKFNDAITKLGEVVKEIITANETPGKDIENIQYPKIEIIQKAILCLNNSTKEKTQLKAEILALQVKLDFEKKRKNELKDASTQVLLDAGKKGQKNKHMRSFKLKKAKRKVLKEITVKSKADNQNFKEKLPKIIPRSNIFSDKKAPENTIVVLPATPYIFPQRPLLFPTVPPAIVLVDPSNINKSICPIVNRNNGEVTKTTMVNILPISAYSGPLSATKTKKNNIKSKKENNKKGIKNSRLVPKDTKANESNIKKDTPVISEPLKITLEANSSTNAIERSNREKEQHTKERDSVKEIPDCIKSSSKDNSTNVLENTGKNVIVKKSIEKNIQNKENKTNIEPKTKCDKPLIQNTSTLAAGVVGKVEVITDKPSNNIGTNETNSKLNKSAAVKVLSPSEEKEKETKLSNILDTSLCDTAVDGGNARLELAEEFLAASPTAAFLMSFPLVSGNRADSPAEEPQSTVQSTTKESNQRRNEPVTQPNLYFEKPNINDVKIKPKPPPACTILRKHNEPKFTDNNIITKQIDSKSNNAIVTNSSTDNPFLNLPMPSLTTTSCTISDTTFGLDFDCNISKPMPNQTTSYSSNNNFFYKSDPFNSVKNTIYSTSSITSGHDFNSLGLYPCAMEKYATKNKSDYTNVEENLMKIGSSRLTYDIDLGWSHKSFDFVNCTTTANTFNKDNILTTVAAPYTSSYNPFNPEFHVPLVTNKKDNVTSKSSTSFADTITSFYSQPSNLWSEDVPFYSNNMSKSTAPKHQNYLPLESLHSNINQSLKPTDKHFEPKQSTAPATNVDMKTPSITVEQLVPGKFTKKSPNKMHINWMTSEIRPMETNCNPAPIEAKNSHKTPYTQISNPAKKQDHESYFPISMHNFAAQPSQEEFQMWPSTRPVGPTEITIEPPPINLPTLVGDLALGPHDKKKNTDIANRALAQTQDIQNCSNFLSVTQLMNRSDNMQSRYIVPSSDTQKTNPIKQLSSTYFSNDTHRKSMTSRVDSHLPQPCYGFNEPKAINSYENLNQFSHNKSKVTKTDKSSKSQKNSYSAEALIRGGGCTQKIQDSTKFTMSQKYNEFNATQDNSIAQVSHFPPILDYSDNGYASQQFSGTTLYNTTTNTISNSFYSNFMPGSGNLMSSNFASGPFSGEFIDYNQTDCNYTNHKYEELKMRNNPSVYPQDKVPSNYKNSRRESATKHKLECSKKDSTKKYQSKRSKVNTDVDEWNDPSHLLWQAKTPSKRHSNLMSEELSFPNYVGNQMPTQYQPEFFNSHLMPSNVQSVGHNVDRSLSFPVTSRANFNLSTIFPEITMKVQ